MKEPLDRILLWLAGFGKKLKSLTSLKVMVHAAEIAAINQATGIIVDEQLTDGQTLPVHGEMNIIHMPGHTPGSINLYVPKQRTLIAGDALFSAGQWLIVSPAYLCEDPQQAKESVRKLLEMNLDIEKVVVGHGEDLHERERKRLGLTLVDIRDF
jgi:glyoxylase-like metal-dependent hydrolase (beta-lactamase superfamily II)